MGSSQWWATGLAAAMIGVGVTACDSGDEVIDISGPLWSASVDPEVDYETDIEDLLPEALTRVHHTEEHRDELVEALAQLVDDSLESIASADMSEASLLLVRYDGCGGTMLNLQATPETDPPVIMVNVLAAKAVCDSPQPELEVWEIPEQIDPETAVIEREREWMDG